jgi:hypothetical protein
VAEVGELDWARVSRAVEKPRDQCLHRFLQLSIEDPFLTQAFNLMGTNAQDLDPAHLPSKPVTPRRHAAEAAGPSPAGDVALLSSLAKEVGRALPY